MVIDAGSLGYREVNEALRRGGPEAVVNGCTGQRFIAAGASDIKVTLNGTPGNAMFLQKRKKPSASKSTNSSRLPSTASTR